MKLAVIAPKHLMPYVAPLNLGYHMALGQELSRDAKYREIFRRLGNKGHFIMVDNGAAEHDVIPFDQIVHHANMIHAAEIVMPDVLRNGQETLRVLLDPAALKLVPANRRMVVPQGDSWDEWEVCLHTIASSIYFASIGVAKHLERLDGGRSHALKVMKEHGYLERFQIHMLGCYDNPLMEAHRARMFRPRGLDTGAPIAYAQAGYSLHLSQHHSLDWKAGADPDIIRSNLKSLLEACNG